MIPMVSAYSKIEEIEHFFEKKNKVNYTDEVLPNNRN